MPTLTVGHVVRDGYAAYVVHVGRVVPESRVVHIMRAGRAVLGAPCCAYHGYNLGWKQLSVWENVLTNTQPPIL